MRTAPRLRIGLQRLTGRLGIGSRPLGATCTLKRLFEVRIQSARAFSSASLAKESASRLENAAAENPVLDLSVAASSVADAASGAVKAASGAVGAAGEAAEVAEVVIEKSWKNIELLLDTLAAIHTATDTSWWVTIAGATLVTRILLFPIAVKIKKQAALMTRFSPEMQIMQERIKLMTARGDKDRMEAERLKMAQFLQENSVNPFKSFLLPMIQAPIFVSFFFALRKLPERTDIAPNLADDPFFWISSIGDADPYYLLPIASGVTMLATIELSTQDQQATDQVKTMKQVMRAMCVGIPFFTYTFPTTVFIYWITSNLWTLAQTFIFRVPALQKLLKIPDSLTAKEQEKLKEDIRLREAANYKTQPEAQRAPSSSPVTYFDDLAARKKMQGGSGNGNAKTASANKGTGKQTKKATRRRKR